MLWTVGIGDAGRQEVGVSCFKSNGPAISLNSFFRIEYRCQSVDRVYSTLVIHTLACIIVSMIDGYLTTRQASEKSGISQAHLRRLMEYGKLSGLKIGRDWLIDVSSLDRYVANRPKRGPKPASREMT